MLINFTLVIIVAILVALLITFLFYKLFVKLKKKAVAGIFTGLVIGGIAIAGITVSNARVYVVKGGGKYSTYAAYGTPEYKMSNGKSVQINIPFQNSIVINDSEEVLVLEKIYYGISTAQGKDELIGAYEYVKVKDIVEHFFDNRPPSSIKKETTGSYVLVYWLRTLKAYEEEYGTVFTGYEYQDDYEGEEEEEEEYEEDEEEYEADEE